MIRTAVAGASGYAGGELLRLLTMHPAAQLGAVTAASSAGTLLAELHPNLASLGAITVQPTSAETLADHDVVFLALPHGASASIVETLSPGTIVIDLSADFRLEDASAWANFYDSPYAGSWPYALLEYPGARAKIAGATRIAVPGCFPTLGTLSLWPAFNADLLEADVTITAASGTSGAGRSLQTRLLASEVMGSMSTYGVGGGHRHTPELEQNLSNVAGQPVAVTFTPMLAPMSRGMIAISTAKLAPGVIADDLAAAYTEAYADEQFVTVLPEGQWPQTSAVYGSNAAHVQLAVDERTNRLTVVGVLDNLGKGAAGAAVQAMNVAMGFDEGMGLTSIGVAP